MKKINSSEMRALIIVLFSINCLLVPTLTLNAIEIDTLKNISLNKPHEVFEGEYFPVSRDDMKKSPAYHVSGSGFYTTQVNISETGDNIVGDAANEPSMAIDPTNPDKMVIGWRQFNTIQNSFRQAGYAYTLDGGETWTFPGVINEGVFRSDPVLDSDSEGNIFYNSLTVEGNNYYCDVYKMEVGGTEWDDGVYAKGGDKQWMVIDKTDGEGNGNIYAQWNASYSICYPNDFTRSADEGESYEECVRVSGSPRWGTLATGPDGTLYVAGYSDFGFIVAKSGTAQDADEPVEWDGFTEVYLDGYASIGTGPNPVGLLGQTWVGVDNSDGANSGNVYLLCSVERYNNDDPVDVMFSRSINGGFSWSEPKRVNQDIGNFNWQWFGTMSVAPTGRIDVVWLDTRGGSPGTYESALFYSYSIDGGQSFSANEQVSDYFDPHLGWPQQEKMGDYFHMVSDVDYAHLAWANTLNGEQDVYYTRINPWFVGLDENKLDDDIIINLYPNPAKDNLTVRFKTEEKRDVDIVLIDMLGKEVLSRKALGAEANNQAVKFDISSLDNGVYFVQVKTGALFATARIIIAN